jgi:hypothetical protein
VCARQRQDEARRPRAEREQRRGTANGPCHDVTVATARDNVKRTGTCGRTSRDRSAGAVLSQGRV